MMVKIGRQSKRHNNKSYYEPGIFKCEWVWLKRYNKRKLTTLYHGPYKVLSCSEQSMIIQKNSEVVKVSIKNVKAYVPESRRVLKLILTTSDLPDLRSG